MGFSLQLTIVRNMVINGIDNNQQKLYDYEENGFLPYGNDGRADPFSTEYL